MMKPWGESPSSCLLSNENGGIRHSKVLPSCRSILNVPLEKKEVAGISYSARCKKLRNVQFLICIILLLTTCGHLVLVKRHDWCTGTRAEILKTLAPVNFTNR